MSALQFMTPTIEQDIQFHSTWLGNVSGLKAEKLLRNKNTPYLYVLRAGECVGDYYITFVAPDFSIIHRPFEIIVGHEGWSYRNGGNGGPYLDATIDDVLHLIMHCEKDECVPFVPFK